MKTQKKADGGGDCLSDVPEQNPLYAAGCKTSCANQHTLYTVAISLDLRSTITLFHFPNSTNQNTYPALINRQLYYL